MKKSPMMFKTLIAALMMVSAPALACEDHEAHSADPTSALANDTVSGATSAPNERSEFRKSIEAKLDDMGASIDELKRDASEATGGAKVNLNAKLAKLEKRRDEIKADLARTSDDSNRAWDRFKAGVKKSVNELEAGFKDAKNEFNDKVSKAKK